jgi:chaperonin GroEL
MKKDIQFNVQAREKIMTGINKMADAVSVTLGANGRYVIISPGFWDNFSMRRFPLHSTKDGITVASQIELEDPTENIGARLMWEASKKTADQAGDGTTTTIVIGRAIARGGLELLKNSSNPVEIKRGIDAAVSEVIREIEKIAIPVGEGIDKIRQIATVSANNDPVIGDLIAGAFEKIGNEGMIDIEESKSINTEIKITDGFKFDRGYESAMFCNSARNECILEEPLILMYDKSIFHMKDLAPVLQIVSQKGKPLLIICDEMDGTSEALPFLIVNNSQKKISCCVVKAPNYGDQKREIMEDIAAATGGDYLGDLVGIDLQHVELDHLGKAKRVIVTKETTTIIGGEKGGAHEDLLNEIRMNRTKAEGDDEIAKIDARIARLTSKTAIIAVGAPTETEMKEKKDRCDDAIRATKAAMAEGYLPGAGTAFIRIAERGWEVLEAKGKDFNEGKRLVYNALFEPLKQLCSNAGVDFEPVRDKVVLSANRNLGYNALTNEVEDLLTSGIIDPAKVLRCCIQNAASSAGMFLITECTISDCI